MNSEPLIDPRAIIRSAWANRGLVGGIMLGALVLAILLVLFLPRSYDATSRVLLEIGQDRSSPLPQDRSQPLSADEAVWEMQTQVDLLNTDAMANIVLQRMSRDPQAASLVQGLTVRDLRDHLQIVVPRDSRIVPIAFSAHNADAAALVANAYADAMIEFNSQTRASTNQSSLDFLGKQLDQAKVRLEKSQNDLVQYNRSAGLLDPGQPAVNTPSTPAVQSLTSAGLLQINTSYSEAKANRIAAQQKWQQAQSTPLLSLPEVVNDPAIQRLTQQKAEITASLHENSKRYTNNYPAMKQASANVAEIDRQILILAEQIRKSILNQYQVAAGQEAALAKAVGGLRQQAFSEQSRSVRHDVLQLDVQTNTELYDALLQRFKQLNAEAALNPTKITVVDRAEPGNIKASPGSMGIIALALALGLMFSVLAVYLRQAFDDRIRDPSLIQSALGVPVLSVFPVGAPSDTILDLVLDATSPMAFAAQTLRTKLDLNQSGGRGSFMLTSRNSRDDRAMVALSLARAFAVSGGRVLLVDGDLRIPRIGSLLGSFGSHSFFDVIAGRVSLADAVVRSPELKFDVLMGRGGSPTFAMPMVSRLRDMFAQISACYDYVIIDGPPILATPEGLSMASVVDSTMYVMRSGDEAEEDVRLSLAQLRANGIDFSGVVVTEFQTRHASSSYSMYTPAAAAAF